MATSPPPTIDPHAAARWARLPLAASPWLHEEVAQRMEQRLQWLVAQPSSWLHWEPLRGGWQAHALIAKRYPDAKAYTLPSLIEQPVDMLWANMALHATAEPHALLAQWYELLAPDGLLLFSCLGPDTLRGLRALYAAQGWGPPAQTFTDMHDWGDMLLQTGFADPVMDRENLDLTFATPQRLLQELRELGRNLHPQRFAALRGRHWLAQLHAALQTHLPDPAEAGRLKLHFEILYGHARKPASPRLAVQPHSSIPLQQMRAALGLGHHRTQ